jgi:hypothetical protein
MEKMEVDRKMSGKELMNNKKCSKRDNSTEMKKREMDREMSGKKINH